MYFLNIYQVWLMDKQLKWGIRVLHPQIRGNRQDIYGFMWRYGHSHKPAIPIITYIHGGPLVGLYAGRGNKPTVHFSSYRGIRVHDRLITNQTRLLLYKRGSYECVCLFSLTNHKSHSFGICLSMAFLFFFNFFNFNGYFFQVKDHPIFQRDDFDIHVYAPIPLSMACLGGQIVVPTLTGEVDLKVCIGFTHQFFTKLSTFISIFMVVSRTDSSRFTQWRSISDAW